MNRKLIGVSVFIIFIGLIVVFGQEERSFLSDMTSDDNHQLSSEEENTSSDKEQSTVPNTIREKLSNSANELKKRLEKKDAEINKLKRENAQLMEKIKEQDDAMRTIAKIYKIPNSKYDTMSLSGLVSEIKSQNDANKYPGTNLLSENDLSFIEDVCVDEPRIIRIIRSYDMFIKQIRTNPYD